MSIGNFPGLLSQAILVGIDSLSREIGRRCGPFKYVVSYAQ